MEKEEIKSSYGMNIFNPNPVVILKTEIIDDPSHKPSKWETFVDIFLSCVLLISYALRGLLFIVALWWLISLLDIKL
jgi:hypothetical protein